MQFLIAGYETTNTVIGNCLKVLAIHPEELQKLQDEIDKNISPEVSFNINKFNIYNLFMSKI